MANSKKTIQKNKKQKKSSISKDYKPSKNEEFMNPVMLEYFRNKLIARYNEIVGKNKEYQEDLTAEALELSGIVLESKSRNTQMLKRIEAALQRVNNGSYGYCEITGEPIEIKRLELCPDTTMSTEAQEMYEDGLI